MEPKFWGNAGWFMIFIVIFTYFNDVEKMKRMVYFICNALPCLNCRQHVLSNISNNDILSEKNSMRILHFFIELRNAFQYNKPEYTESDKIPQNKFIINRKLIKGDVLLSQHKALILSSFCYEFSNKLNKENEEEFIKIKSQINTLLNELTT